MTTTNILPFRTFTDEPQYANQMNRQPVTCETTIPKPIKLEKIKPVIIEVLPNESLPNGYTDYRPLLQRDGLIFYAWEVYEDAIKIVWLTANRSMYKYQAFTDNESELKSLMPKKRYSENRYGYRQHDKEPSLIIYTAPAGLTVYTRNTFITLLKKFGVSVNFDYEFTLGSQKAEQERTVLYRLSENNLNTEETELLEVYRQLSSNEKIKVIERLKTLLNNQELIT